MPPDVTDEQRALLDWGASVRRDLPWRHTRDPWAVLVSEVMLQQTQVARVVPKWNEFLRRWPSPTECAAASLAELLEVWTGLGYPRRLRSLQATAKVVVTDHGGRIPIGLDELLALPGIGPYTARAVQAFAFEADVGVVDTNIARVLARRSGRRLTAREAQDAADRFATVGDSWAHNQSLMDLGAMLCRPSPLCESCPLAPTCSWARSGWPSPDPAVGSAGVSTSQSRFAGSDREGRGRLLRAAAEGTIDLAALTTITEWHDDPERAQRVVRGLVTEGFLAEVPSGFVLAD